MPVYLLIVQPQPGSTFIDHLSAADPQAAEAIVLQRFFGGPNVIMNNPRDKLNYALIELTTSGTIAPNLDLNSAILSSDGSTNIQAQLLQAAKSAIANNQTYLAIGSPTNAQVVAQVSALTRQIDGVMRLLVNDFSGTS